MVGLGVWVQMSFLEVTRRIMKACERWTATLVQWRRAFIIMPPENIQGTDNRRQEKINRTEGVEE